MIMAPPFFFLFTLSSLLSIDVFVHGHDKEPEQSVPFTYEGSHGPQYWGNLKPYFERCSNGKSQSPIDIVKDKTVFNKNLQPLIRRYASANATLINNGFNIGVLFEENAGSVAIIDGKNYTFKQMHWHSPSEHRLDGKQFAAELHLVHQAGDRSVAIVTILHQYGDPDPLLAKFEDKLAELAKEVCGGNEEAHIALGTLDTKHLRKKTRKYFRYVGSLTIPPCYENILWTILGKVRTISKEQVEALKAPLHPSFKNNARPPQQLNGRQVQIYDELSER